MRGHRPRLILRGLPIFIGVAAVLTAFSLPIFAADPSRRDPRTAKMPEFVEMLWSIIRHGANMGPDSGWFHPSESRYEWRWLAARFDKNNDGVVTADELKGSSRLFRALDRDGDGAVDRDDLDWSPRSRYLQSRSMARGRFAMMDRNGNGRINITEWENAFKQAANGKAFLTPDDIASLLYAPPPVPRPATNAAQPSAAEGPSRITLLKGLFTGEIGSSTEGPNLGEDAPAFTLETHDKSKRISLADYRGKKPVVLIFGSFT